MKNRRLFLSTLLFLIISSNLLSQSHLKQQIVSLLQESGVSSYLAVFLLSMLPIFELRASIPIGIITFGLSPIMVFLVSIVGNMVPIFFILVFLKYLEKLLFRWSLTKKLLNKVYATTRAKSKVIEKYEELGLLLFVAIPLPITGAWTGSLASYLLGLKIADSLLFIFLGVVCAGIIVISLTLLGFWGAVIAIVALLVLIAVKTLQIWRRKTKTPV